MAGEELFCGKRIEHRLQRLAAGDELAALALGLAGLVIGDPHQPGGMALDEIDRSAELNAAVEVDGAGYRLRIGLPPLGPVLEPERQLEMPGHVAGVVLACPPQPFAQIGADRSDAVVPDAVDRGRKVVLIAGGDFRDDRIELLPRPVEVARPHREQASLPQTREQLELDVVDERSALQRIELVDRLRHLARRETVDGLEEEPVGAAGVVLERGRRVAARRRARASP